MAWALPPATTVRRQSAATAIENNLVYANTAEGILVSGGNGTQVVNNTVYQIVGDAVQVNGSSQNVTVLNNILWTHAGYDLDVASDSQQGFTATTMTCMPRVATNWRCGERRHFPSRLRPPIR